MLTSIHKEKTPQDVGLHFIDFLDRLVDSGVRTDITKVNEVITLAKQVKTEFAQQKKMRKNKKSPKKTTV